MEIHYNPDAAALHIFFASGVGPAMDFVDVEREAGTFQLDFNGDGQLIGIIAIGQIEKMFPQQFLDEVATRS